VSVFDAKDGPCYRCIFPEPPPPGLVPSCAEGGVLGVLPGTVGTLQATEAIKLLLGKGYEKDLLRLDVWNNSIERIKIKKDASCGVCRGEFKLLDRILGKREPGSEIEFQVLRCRTRETVKVKPKGRVKLDLEARGLIQRVVRSRPQRIRLAGKPQDARR